MKKFWLLALILVCAPTLADEPDPESIYNYHEVTDAISTSGQLHDVQVSWLRSQGFDLVVNLAVASEDHNLEESYHVTNAGMSYVQIPVPWDNPTRGDLDLFFAVMDARADRKSLVHCFANYRASAFTYLYRVIREGVPEEEARIDLLSIWDDEAFEQYPVWREFIDTALEDAGH